MARAASSTMARSSCRWSNFLFYLRPISGIEISRSTDLQNIESRWFRVHRIQFGLVCQDRIFRIFCVAGCPFDTSKFCLLKNIRQRTIGSHDKCRAASTRTCAETEMPVISEIFVNYNAISPHTNGTYREVLVNHSIRLTLIKNKMR
jgi:hypothetical protein